MVKEYVPKEANAFTAQLSVLQVTESQSIVWWKYVCDGFRGPSHVRYGGCCGVWVSFSLMWFDEVCAVVLNNYKLTTSNDLPTPEMHTNTCSLYDAFFYSTKYYTYTPLTTYTTLT